jgi:prophage antirepressor-like protein
MNDENKGLMAFYYEGYQVRKPEINNELWFVGKDVAEALRYSEESNPARLFSNVPEEWKGVKPIHTPGGIQEMLCLSEQGLYFFLGRSDKPAALPFQKWIAGEVVPSIRKQGYYALDKQVLERLDKMEAQLEKLKERGNEAYKKLRGYDEELKARVGEYVDGLNNMADRAKGEVIEYLVSSHKPSAHEAQLADLKRYLSLTIAATGDTHDKIDLFKLYPGYEAECANPIPKDAFAAHVLLLYPQIKFSRGNNVFTGCRFDY